MATLQQAHDLARILLGERQTPPEVFTDAHLLQLSPEVYREIQRRYSAAGHPLLKDYVNFDISSGTVAITDGTGTYPAAGIVIKPITLWEGAQGSTLIGSFVQMEEAWPYLIPRAVTAVLTHWEWKNKTLYFVGSSASRTVRMLYSKYLADLTAVGDLLAIPNVVGALAQGTAAAAARARGADARSKDLESVFGDIVNELIAADAGRGTGA